MVMEVETSSTLAFLLKSSFQIEKKKKLTTLITDMTNLKDFKNTKI